MNRKRILSILLILILITSLAVSVFAEGGNGDGSGGGKNVPLGLAESSVPGCDDYSDFQQKCGEFHRKRQ